MDTGETTSDARWVLEGGRLLDPSTGTDVVGHLVCEGGRILASGRGDAPPPVEGERRVELNGAWVTPGLIDLRASLREPGEEQRETIASGLRAAASAGFTAVCATPDTAPCIDAEAVVAFVLGRAAEITDGAQLLPVGCLTKGLDGQTLAPMGELAAAGCVAVSQGEAPVPSPRVMRRALEYAGMFDLPVFVSPVDASFGGLCDEGPWSTRLGLPPAPSVAELLATERDLRLAELTGARLHLQRLSTRGAVEAVRAAKARGVPVTADVAAHHLVFTAEALRGYDARFKVWPPFRSEADRAALIDGLADGTLDAVVTDHQPHRGQDKAYEYALAATGASAIETTPSVLLGLAHDGALPALDAVARLTTGPATVLGRAAPSLRAGAPADVTVLDASATWIPTPHSLRSAGKNTPFVGTPMRGVAAVTFVAGRPIHITPTWSDRVAAAGRVAAPSPRRTS